MKLLSSNVRYLFISRASIMHLRIILHTFNHKSPPSGGGAHSRPSVMPALLIVLGPIWAFGCVSGSIICSLGLALTQRICDAIIDESATFPCYFLYSSVHNINIYRIASHARTGTLYRYHPLTQARIRLAIAYSLSLYYVSLRHPR